MIIINESLLSLSPWQCQGGSGNGPEVILLVYGPDHGDVQPTVSISQHIKIISILRYSVSTLHKKCKRRLSINREQY